MIDAAAVEDVAGGCGHYRMLAARTIRKKVGLETLHVVEKTVASTQDGWKQLFTDGLKKFVEAT